MYLLLLLLLLLLPAQAAAAATAVVPPPTNVTVTCSNLRTLVTWTYQDRRPGTRFKVEVVSSESRHENVTTEHRYDLTPFVWQTEYHYMGFHGVRVTALQGALQSEPASSQTFSFEMNRVATTKCALDFPPVHLAAEDSGNVVSFQNPFFFYPELKLTIRQPNSGFIFNVSWSQARLGAADQRHQMTSKTSTQQPAKSKPTFCRQNQPMCRLDLPPSAGEQPCVRLRGWLVTRNWLEKVPFRETELICPTEATGDHMVVLLVLLTVLVLGVTAVTALVCKERAWTLKSAPQITLTIEPDAEKKLLQLPQEETFSPVDVIQRRDSSGCSTDSDRHESTYSLRDDVNPGDGGGSSEEEQLDQGYVRDQDSAGEEEPEEEEAAGYYDRPHAMRAELGGGDRVHVPF